MKSKPNFYACWLHHMAYFLVHSLASSLYFDESVLNNRAMSGTSGSSGLGSQSSEQIDKRTVDENGEQHWEKKNKNKKKH